MYEFHPDGTVDYSFGAIVDSFWRIEANELVSPPATVNGPELRATIKWIIPNKFLLIDQGVTKAELTRVGSSSDSGNPILGEWSGMRDMDGRKVEMHWSFFASGKSLLLLPFLTQHGRYTAEGSTLSIKLQNESPMGVRYEVKDEILTVMGTDKSDKSHFARY